MTVECLTVGMRVSEALAGIGLMTFCGREVGGERRIYEPSR